MNDCEPSAAFERMCKFYAGLDSYRDQGYVESIFYPDTERARTKKMRFQTFFRSPNLFRFEWVERQFEDGPEVQHGFCCDGKSVYQKYSWSKLERVGNSLLFDTNECLRMAIASATGVSNGAARSTSILLMPDLVKKIMIPSTAAVFESDETYQNEPCIWLKLSSLPNEQNYIWISKDSNTLLRREKELLVQPSNEPPLARVEKEAFRSIGKFLRWWRVRELAKKVREEFNSRKTSNEPFTVRTKTVYEQIEINVDISADVFDKANLFKP